MSAQGLRGHFRRHGEALLAQEGDLSAGLGELARLPPLVLYDILGRVERDKTPEFTSTYYQKNSREFLDLRTVSKAFRTAIHNCVTVFVAKVEFGDLWLHHAPTPEDLPAPVRRWPTLAALQCRRLALHRLETLSHWPALSNLTLWLVTYPTPGLLAFAVRALGQGCPMLRKLTLCSHKRGGPLGKTRTPGVALDLTPLLACRHLNTLQLIDLTVVPFGVATLSTLRDLTWTENEITTMDVPELPLGLEELTLTMEWYCSAMNNFNNTVARVPLHIASKVLTSSLRALRLSDVELHGDVHLPPSLQRLSLIETVITGGGRFVGEYPCLTDLSIDMRILVRCVRCFLSAASLKSLDLGPVLDDTGFVMLNLAELSRCTNLRSLALRAVVRGVWAWPSGYVDDRFPELTLSPFQLLESLLIEGYWGWGPVGVFRDLPNLRELRVVCHAYLHLVQLGGLPSLRVLEFSAKSSLDRVEGLEEILPHLDEESRRRCQRFLE